ncbi:MAG: coproporphyrinogen-III oxidase family protein, partial [Phycisphaerae bacterium]
RSAAVPQALAALDAPPAEGSPLGIYLHIPFCRKRCKFCYFRVYTDKNGDEVQAYIDALGREVALYADRPGLAGRQFDFVYFGGGTPSFISAQQLARLIDRIREHWTWDSAREVTFECEPGTLQKHKLEAIKAIGVTRLSLGIEHFDDAILDINGRAHRSPEIVRAYDWARDVGFDQINVDLIAGLVGDTDEKWTATVERTLRLEPDSVTIYQMELPFNTVIAREARQRGETAAVADWPTKRRWVDEAFRRFEAAGYVVSSGYTLIKPSPGAKFVYRDALWRGADLIGTGVASFSHFAGVHYQNVDTWEDYIGRLQQGELPIGRALPMTKHQALIREMIIQLKLGRLDAGYFREKFGVSIVDELAAGFDLLVREDLASVAGDDIRLSRQGLLRVDALLPRFFEPEHRNIRYT